MKLFFVILGAVLLASCSIRPLRPGFGWIKLPDGSVVGIQQSENPKSDSTLKSGKTEIRIGASQKDTAREISAKLSSLKGIMYLGAVVFIFGLASIFWLPLKTIIGSTTTSVAIAAGGLALCVLPTMIVGNEALIFGGVAVAIALWFLAHRHGKARGELESLKR